MKKEDLYVAFSKLFSGLESAYGILPIDPQTAESHAGGAKLSISPFVKKEPISFTNYQEHLDGTTSLAVIPINEEACVRFCALDVDVYPIEIEKYNRVIKVNKLPLIPCRTKSGGVHLYMFFTKDTPATKALSALKQLRMILGLPESTEMYPRQVHLSENGLGTVLNIPYFNADNTTRYAWGEDGQPLSLEEFITLARQKQTTYERFLEWYGALPFSSAPPCLQQIFLSGKLGSPGYGRNTFLFSAATYLKARFGIENLLAKLEEVNRRLESPLDAVELNKIVSSHNKGTYGYQCSDGCFSEYCNKEECKQREYGKGGKYVSDFSFEGLQQVKTNPPYYIWTVSGHKMVFMNETEIRKQDKFMDYCLRYLHKLPNRLKEQAWYGVLNTALTHIETVVPTEEEDMGEEVIFTSAIIDFLTNRVHAKSKEQVALGQVYFSKEEGFIFRPGDLTDHLVKAGVITGKTSTILHYKLKVMGGKATRLYVNAQKRQIRVWALPANIVELASVDTPEVALSLAVEQSKSYSSSEQLTQAALALKEEIEAADTVDFETSSNDKNEEPNF